MSLKPLIAITFAEAISWLGLLVAMVLKYGFDKPEAVSVLGMVHGVLFMIFVVLLVITATSRKWPVRKIVISFLESIPPFLGFVLGRQLLEEDKRDYQTKREASQA